jgi:hypothetical protein
LQLFKRALIDPFEAMHAAGASKVGQSSEQASSAFLEPSPPPVRNPQAGGYFSRLGSAFTSATPQPKYLPITDEQKQQQLQQAQADYPATTGAARGAGEFVGGMAADPRMWPMMFAPGALPVAQRLMNAGFSIQMLAGAYKNYPEIKAAADKGDVHETARLIAQLAPQLYFGAKGAVHSVAPGAFEPTVGGAAKKVAGAASAAAGAVGEATGVGLTPAEMMKKAGGPSVQGQAGQNLDRNLEIAAPRIVEQDGIKKINTVQDMADGAGAAADRVWNKGYAPQIARHANETINVSGIGDQIRSGVDPSTRELFPEEGEKADSLADKFTGDITLDKAQNHLRAINAQLKPFYKMTPEQQVAAGITSGRISSLENAAQGLREGIDAKLESLGEQDPQGLRQEYGALKSIEGIFDKRAVVTGRQKSITLAQLVAGGTGIATGLGRGTSALLQGDPLGAAVNVAAGAVPFAATTAEKYYNSPDNLVRRAIRGYAKTARPARPLPEPPATPPPTGPAGGPQQPPLPFGQGPLWQINQTPGTPPAPPIPTMTGEQEGLPFGHGPLWQVQQTPTSVPPETRVTNPARMLGPTRLPASIRNPSPNLEAPMAPSPSAEASAVQTAAEQGRGRGPVGTLRQLGMVPGPSGFPEAKVTQSATPAGEVAPAGTETPAEGIPKKPPLFSRRTTTGEDEMEAARRGAAGEPPAPTAVERAQSRVQALQSQLEQQRAQGDSAQYNTVSQLRNAQDELEAAQRKPSPLGPVFSRPLTAPPEPTSQLDLGLGLPKRGEPFYSKAEQVADAKLPKAGTGDAFLATLRNNGVKAEELSDLKLDDFAGKPKVTKQEFLDAIRSRRPQLEQTTLQEAHGDTSYEKYTTEGGRNYRETLTQYPQSDAGAAAESFKREADERQREMDDEIDRHNAAKNPEDLGFPDDYFDKEREAIRGLRAQQRAAEAEARRTEFTSGHWVEHPNVLAHSRESDFTTTDGMPVRHVHEWQSDLHQKGREQGYQTPPLRQLPEGYSTKQMSGGGFQILDQRGRLAMMPGDETDIASFPGAQNQEDAIDAYLSRANIGRGSGAPDVPFKKSWHELAVKDSIRRAVRDGMHGMTWDTGETQANRYDLAKQVERIEYDPDTHTLDAYDHSGDRVINESVRPDELHNYIGKEAAEKLHDKIEDYYPPSNEEDYSIEHDPESETYHVLDANGERVGEEETRRDAQKVIEDYVQHDRDNQELPTLRGLDLKVGGEGMSGFYDKMIPDFIRKYTKKWGAKVDTAEIPTGETRSEMEYAGPDKSEDEVRQAWERAAHRGPREWKQTKGGAWAWFEGDRQVSGAFHDKADRPTAAHTISNDPTERELRYVLEQVHRGVPFKQAMSAATPEIAEQFGGKLQKNEIPETTTVHRLNFTPEMINAVKSEGQPLYTRRGDQLTQAKALETLQAARQMKPTIDEGGPDRAARLHIDDATHALLNNLVPSGDWLGVNFHESDARGIAQMLRRNADALEPTGQSQAVANMRTLASHIERVHNLNFDPAAPGHGGVPIVHDLSSEAHEAEMHVGQRTLSPTGDVLDYTNVEKAADHPAVRKAWPALEKIGATSHPGLAVSELEAHIRDGNHEFFGLTREEAVDFIEHAGNVLAEHHGEQVMADPPRLARRYIQSLRDYVEGGRRGGEQTAAQATQLGGTGEGPEGNDRAGQPTEGAAPSGGGETGSEEVTPQRTPLKSSVKLMGKPLPVRGTGPAGRVKVGDVGKALQKFSRSEEGPAIRASEATRDEMIKRYAKAAVPEVKYQLAQDKTGLDWYKDDIANTQRTFAQNGYPELDPDKGDPTKQTMFRALVAGASLGNREIPTIRNAEKMWNEYKRTGKAPITNPETGLGYQNGQFNAYQWGFKALNELLKQKGEKGTAQWLMTQHPVSELKQYRAGVPGKASDMKYGAHVFGDKMGPFFLNMGGIHSELTADLWHSRRFNRIMGTLEDPSTGSGLADAPRNSGERSIMKQAEEYVARKLGLDTSAAQSVGWNYEQSLYNVHGIERELASYADAARQHFAGRAAPAKGANAPAGSGPPAAGQAPVSRGLPQGVGRGQQNLPAQNPRPAARAVAPVPQFLKRVSKR